MFYSRWFLAIYYLLSTIYFGYIATIFHVFLPIIKMAVAIDRESLYKQIDEILAKMTVSKEYAPFFKTSAAKRFEYSVFIERLLLIKTPKELSREEIVFALQRFFKSTQNETDYELNYATGIDNKYKGFCYLWVSNLSIYYLLLGKNEDGSERVERKENPNYWAINRIKNLTFKLIPDWGDYSIAEDCLEETYGPDIIEIPLAPIFQLPYAYVNSGFKKNQVPFLIEPVKYVNAEKGRNKMALFAQRVPDMVTLSQIRTVFSRLVNDEFEVVESNRRIGRCLQVEFKNPTDAFVVLQLFRKRLIKTRTGVVPLIFNYLIKY